MAQRGRPTVEINLSAEERATLERWSAPPDATHWSTRTLAAKHRISHTTVREIWRPLGLKPWREDSFRVSPDLDLME
jgi:hypothetical protein